MARNYDDQETIRQYLLRELDDEHQQRIEKRLITEEDLFEELDIVEDELIDDYLAEKLSDDERKRFERGFLVTPDRNQKLRFARALRRHISTATPQTTILKPSRLPLRTIGRHTFLTSPLAKAAVLLIIVGLGFAVWRGFFYQSDVDKGLLALNAAYRQQRPLETRITQFEYARFVTTRGPGSNNFNEADLQRAEFTLLGALKNKPTPAVHHALGKVYLAKREFVRAIEQFEAALKDDPGNAQVYADLGAALLEKGKAEIEKAQSDKGGETSGKGLEDITRSLESLKKSLELNPNLLEAHFNRALAYEANGLSGPAEADWKEYLKKDSSSPWADEARQKLKLIEERRNKTSEIRTKAFESFLNAHSADDENRTWELIGQSHTSAGNAIVNSLVDNRLTQTAQGEDQEANKTLQVLSSVGGLMIRRGEDRYVSKLVSSYRSIPPAKRAILAEARREMEKGYQLFIISRFNEAILAYVKAKELFDSVGDNPEATFASYRIGHCYVLQPNSKKAQEIFEALFVTAGQQQFQWLLAQSLYQLANIQISLSEYSKAIDYSNQALKLAEKLNDANGVVKSLIQLADEYRSLNNRNRSFSFLERSLIALNTDSLEPMQAWQSYIGISLNLTSFGFASAALEFQKEALRLAIEMARPLIKSRSHQFLGLTYSSLKMYDEAISHVQQAIEIGRALKDEPNGMEMIANASVQLGDIYRQLGKHPEAIAAYDLSLDSYGRLNFPYFACSAHKGKLLSYISQGDDKSTEQEIKTVLAFFKQYREKITEQSQRNTFFDAQQYIYDLAMDHEYSRRKNFQQAFDYSEESRGRTLRDFIQGGRQFVDTGSILKSTSLSSSEPITFSEIQPKVPGDTTIVQYAVLSDKLLIWVVTQDEELVTEKSSIDTKDLTEKIRAYRNAIEGNENLTEAEISEQGKELFRILIEPVERFLTKTNLCVVPDKALHYLPFAALVSPKTGHYLFQDHRLKLAPSSSLFLDFSRIAQSRDLNADERLLSVGNPNFDRTEFPTLPGLPAAAREAEDIAQYYDRRTSRVLVRNDATRKQVEKEAPRAEVIHFAAHYVADDQSEMLSKLVLAVDRRASAARDVSALQVSDIYKMNLPRTRLVVLSACQTGVERQYQGEGAIGLARPFLAKGVPLVVASLWPVDSEATAELMIRFHRYRRQGHRPSAEALQLAQIDMLNSENPTYRKPYTWASFVAIGGDTKF